MARIEARDLAAQLADPRAVAAALGLDKGAMRQARGALMVRCPAHADRGPSLSLRRGADGLLQVRCFGCKLSGDVFTLLGAIDGRGFTGAMERAAELAGGAVVSKTYEPPPPALPGLTDDEIHLLGERVLALGRLSGEVEAYVSRRCLLSAARRAGWAAMPDPFKLGLERELLERAGLVRTDEATGEVKRCWPRHRLVIPWRMPDGRIDTLQRRLVGPGDGRVPPYVFLRQRRPREPYGCHKLRQGVPVAFVEGAVDAEALALITGRRLVALGLPGVNGWVSSWARYAEGRRVYIATDSDPPEDDGRPGPGDRCAAQIEKDCGGGERRRAPDGLDWGKVWELRARERER